MLLRNWIDDQGGIVHRDAAAAAGFRRTEQRAATATGGVSRVRRNWLATDEAPVDLLTAARNTARVTCVSLAARRGWWMPEPPDVVHLSFDPHAASPATHAVAHWGREIAPAAARQLVASIEDALSHIATCLPPEQALAVWESAIRVERLSVDALQRVAWPTLAARECAAAAQGLSDSGLETIFVFRLGPWGLPIRQQVVLAGHRVDVLIGDRLVVQIDGWAHHSSSAQRSRDVALDAELTLRGYTVLRFTYAQIIHEWPKVERTVARAVAAGAHLAA